MTILKPIPTYIGSWLLLIIMANGCTLNIDGNSNDIITEADIEAAGQILGGSLSSDNSGIVLSIDDALTMISDNNTKAKSTSSTIYQTEDRSGRGDEIDYRYSYDSQSGIHTVSFRRYVQQLSFSKSVTDTLKYIFMRANGDFIESPRQDQEFVETIDFAGHRVGTLETPRKKLAFSRQDTFLINGISDTSPTLTIGGVHRGKGTVEINRTNGNTINRSYQLKIDFLNIELNKTAIDTSRTLKHGITGTLNWQMAIHRNSNEKSGTKTIRGTISLNQDGTALLRFRDHMKLFQINLENGEVKDQEKEFEGRVHSVDLNNQSIILVSGRTIHFTNNTEFDDDEYTSLQAVANALNNDINVWAEGEGNMHNGQFLASDVEFETEEDDDTDYIDFEALVSSVNLDARTFTLANDIIVRVNDQTAFDDSGDYHSLQAVADGLSQGIEIIADGEAVRSADNVEFDLTAIVVEFKDENSSKSKGSL